MAIHIGHYYNPRQANFGVPRVCLRPALLSRAACTELIAARMRLQSALSCAGASDAHMHARTKACTHACTQAHARAHARVYVRLCV